MSDTALAAATAVVVIFCIAALDALAATVAVSAPPAARAKAAFIFEILPPASSATLPNSSIGLVAVTTAPAKMPAAFATPKITSPTATRGIATVPAAIASAFRLVVNTAVQPESPAL